MSHFCKRHYQAVAAILRDESRDPNNDAATMLRIREAFSDHFARDNSKYDRDRFMVAATPPQPFTWPGPDKDCPQCQGNPYWGKTLSSWERCQCVKTKVATPATR